MITNKVICVSFEHVWLLTHCVHHLSNTFFAVYLIALIVSGLLIQQPAQLWSIMQYSLNHSECTGQGNSTLTHDSACVSQLVRSYI